MRADVTNFYNLPTPKHVFCKLIDDAVEQAVALDAAAIVVNLLWAPDQPDLHRQCTENVVRLKPRCERYGMPLMVEPMVVIPDGKGGYKTNPDIHKTVALARQAVELGADIVKADIAENLHEYHLVVEAAIAPAPVAPRGGKGSRSGNPDSNLYPDSARGFRHRLRTEYLPAPASGADGPRLPSRGSRRGDRRPGHGDSRG